MLKSWPSIPESVTLCGNRVFTEIIKWKWGSLCLIQYDCVLRKGASLDAETGVHRRKMMWRHTEWTPCDQSIHLQVKRHQNSQQTKPPELASAQGQDRFLFTAPGGNRPHQHLDLRPLASRILRQYIPAVQASPFVVLWTATLANLHTAGFPIRETSSTLAGKITERKGLHLSLCSSQLFRRKAINNPEDAQIVWCKAGPSRHGEIAAEGVHLPGKLPAWIDHLLCVPSCSFRTWCHPYNPFL